jgi:HPt (histidine-containing phosphotransfer) domain-containing protein
MTDSVIDMAAIHRLLEVIGGDRDDLQELIEDFAEIAPELVKKMQNAIQTGDTDSLRIAAHSLKSNARDMGAVSLAESSAQLELACNDGDISGVATDVASIESAVNQASDALTLIATTIEP